MKGYQFAGVLLAGFIASGLTTPVSAATCVGSGYVQFGINSQFEACYDSSAGGTGLFGTPSLFGNNIIFSPNSFTATSSDGAGTNTTSSSVIIRLAAIGSYVFDDLTLVELGDYKLNGENSSVGVSGDLEVDDLLGPISTTDSITSASDLTLNDDTLHDWDAGAATALYWNPTLIEVTITNILEAYTESGTVPSLAFIEKKIVGSSTTLSVGPPPLPPVPVPGAVWLFGSGLLGLFGIARRKAA
jgi:hypothetical protein